MFKKITGVVAISMLMTGCANMTQRDPNLAQFNNVEYINAGQANEGIKSFYTEHTVKNLDPEVAKVCIFQTVKNEDVTLTDSSKSFVGSYTGTYYNIKSSKTVDGGDVIKGDTKRGVMFNGNFKHTATDMFGVMPMPGYVRYTGVAMKKGDTLKITYKQIEHAFQSTGSAANSGFSMLTSLAFIRPADAIKTMSDVSDSIVECIKDYE